MIEILIRAEDGLCREVVKHLNHIEEQILESLAWKVESPLWDKIKENENKVPTCEEVKYGAYLPCVCILLYLVLGNLFCLFNQNGKDLASVHQLRSRGLTPVFAVCLN